MRSSVVNHIAISRQCLLPAFVLAAIACSAPKAAHAQLIINGGFEAPVAPVGAFTTVSAGSSALTGWTIETGSVDVVNNGFWPSFSGVQSLDLDGTGGAVSAGTISQSFATSIGTKYTLSFEYANNYSASSAVTAAVTAVDSSAHNLLSTTISHMSSTVSNMNYTLFTGSFIADTSSTTLRFASTDAPSSQTGIALDAVTVTAVAPEPGALWLAVSGAFPVGIAAFKSRRRS